MGLGTSDAWSMNCLAHGPSDPVYVLYWRMTDFREPHLIFQYISAPNNVCGNGIVESWEECDCGETKRDCQDKCCYAADHRDLPCQLKERKTCR